MKRITFKCLNNIINNKYYSDSEKIEWIKKLLEIEKNYLTD